MATRKPPTADEPAEQPVDLETVVADLAARVANLERHTGAPTPADAEQAQQARDALLLSRLPASFEEALAQEQARQRQAERDG